MENQHDSLVNSQVPPIDFIANGHSWMDPSNPQVPTRTTIEPALWRENRSRMDRPLPILEQACPKCGGLNSFADSECRSCGVVFERYRDLEDARAIDDLSLAKHHALLQQWQKIMENYAEIELHDQFLMDCERAGSLAYAARKYQEILEVAPAEETACAMSKRVVGIMTQKFEPARPMTRWSYRVPMFNGLVILLSTAALFTGLFGPQLRAMAWVGALGLGVAFALRSLSNSRT